MSSRRKAMKPKKTVSFSDLPTLKSEALKNSAQLEEVKFTNTALLIPYHYLAMAWALFKYYDVTVDEVSALTKSFALLVVLQSGYAYVIQYCIAPAASAPKKRKEINALYVVASMAVSLGTAAPIFVALVLFGAPFLSLSVQTLLLALHLSQLVVFPLLITFKFAESASLKAYWEALVKQFTFRNEVYCICAGCVVGTWVGCFPIPLDWDRDWQRWPITLICGGYAGGVCGGVASLVARVLLHEE